MIDRNADIAARVAAGETLRAIGESYGMTRERIRQIARDQGVKSRHGYGVIRAQAVALSEALMPPSEIARKLGVTTPSVYDALRIARVTPVKNLAWTWRDEQAYARVHRMLDLEAKGRPIAEIAAVMGTSYPSVSVGLSRYHRGEPAWQQKLALRDDVILRKKALSTSASVSEDVTNNSDTQDGETAVMTYSEAMA